MSDQQADVNLNLDDMSPKESKVNCYQCDICGGKFKTRRILKVHEERKNCELPFQCVGCSNYFKSAVKMKNHMKNCASITHKCTLCGKELRTNIQLRWHMEIHADSNAFACDLCARKFSRPADLRVHKRCYHGAIDYACATCGIVFNNPASLRSHKNIHLGVQVFACACGKAFTRKDRLQRHSVVHLSVENQFSCPECHKTFARVENLKSHCQSHHKNTFPCPECQFSFSNLIVS